MNRDEIHYIIGDYCAEYEINITESQLSAAVDALANDIWAWIEYNERCGKHSHNVDAVLDRYFSNN